MACVFSKSFASKRNFRFWQGRGLASDRNVENNYSLMGSKPLTSTFRYQRQPYKKHCDDRRIGDEDNHNEKDWITMAPSNDNSEICSTRARINFIANKLPIYRWQAQGNIGSLHTHSQQEDKKLSQS